MLTILALFIGFQSGVDLESLIRDLADDRIEVRERAQTSLIRIGMAVVPALKRVVESNDAEGALRARAVWIMVDRTEREREHDAREMRVLLGRLHPDFVAYWEGRPLKFEGSYFSISASEGPNETLIRPEVHELLRRTEAGRLGGVWIDLESVPDASGSKIEFKRCTQCSPGNFVANRQKAGPLKVRVTGTQTWFSRYPIEFRAPQDGATQWVGDMTIEVAWPEVVIRSKVGWEASSFDLRDPRFTYELKSGSKVSKPKIRGRMVSRGCGSGQPMPPGWCGCLGYPTNLTSKRSPRQDYEIRLKCEAEGVPLEEVSVIRCDVWKPIRIPIDFTVEVIPDKPASTQ